MKAITVATFFLLAICGIAHADDAIPEQELMRAAMGARSLTDVQLNQLEEGLKATPDDFLARATLLGYYLFEPSHTEHVAQYTAHILWLVRNHPESEFAGTPFAQIDNILNANGYAEEKTLWLETIKSHPDNAAILGNAANLFMRGDRMLAEELLKKATIADPLSPKWHDNLGNMYLRESDTESSAASQALAEFEAAESLDKAGVNQYYRLSTLAKAAYAAGNMDKAARYANQLLAAAPSYPRDWNYGNAIHHGNNILGRIALKNGDAELARAYLLKAGQTPGSPSLNSFGPNMSLARELIVAGDTETALQYFELCRKFWKMGGQQLDGWEVAVRNGKTPEFGANLNY
ncbi:MAG TPA: tetratricopeptide repeat protein [Burkholderiaceae bacterium]|nr:tetratricopeptide repeat protein [Burkholderiaceae bacterium]